MKSKIVLIVSVVFFVASFYCLILTKENLLKYSDSENVGRENIELGTIPILNSEKYKGIIKNHFESTITELDSLIPQNIVDKGCIPDEETAVCAAKGIITEFYKKSFEAVYGEDWISKLSATVVFEEEKQNWLVVIKEADGGEDPPTICVVLRKSNAEVVAVWSEMMILRD